MLNVGDVVQLNSGGLKMTVVVVSESAARLFYFDLQGKKNESVIPVKALTKVG